MRNSRKLSEEFITIDLGLKRETRKVKKKKKFHTYIHYFIQMVRAMSCPQSPNGQQQNLIAIRP